MQFYKHLHCGCESMWTLYDICNPVAGWVVCVCERGSIKGLIEHVAFEAGEKVIDIKCPVTIRYPVNKRRVPIKCCSLCPTNYTHTHFTSLFLSVTKQVQSQKEGEKSNETLSISLHLLLVLIYSPVNIYVFTPLSGPVIIPCLCTTGMKENIL